MEAKPSCPPDGENSEKHEQQQLTAESSVGSCPPQQPPNPRPMHRALGRLQSRQPKRSDLLLRLQQQQKVAWQHSDAAGPSGGSFLSSTSPLPSPVHSSIQADTSHGVPSHSTQEGQEGIISPRKGEKKPQKPGKYVCTFCGRPCAKPSVLEKHIRSHTGERPYPCAPCGFSFKTKSNLYKHRKSHAHRIKAGLASSRDEPTISGPEGSGVGEDQEEHTEGESTESEEETGQHKKSFYKEMLRQQRKGQMGDMEGSEESLRLEDSQAVKQRLALRLSERKRGPMASPDDPPSSLSTSSSSQGPGSKGSTESGYFSGSGSTDLCQVSPPSSSAKTYAEIILGKYGRLGGQQRSPHQLQPHSSHPSSPGKEDKSIPFSLPKTQVIEHITKLITINEAVVDTSEIDSVKPRRSSLSRKSSMESPIFTPPKDPYAFDPRGEAAGPSGIKRLQSPEAEPESTPVSSVVPLLRSHSVPSSTTQEETIPMGSRGYRLCQSFDEQQAVVAEMRVSHSPRMLRRQPAIEVPLGAETLEDASTASSSARGTEPAKQPLQEPQKTPSRSECEACGACFQHSDAAKAHKSICPAQGHETGDAIKIGREDRPFMMHYKFRALAMAVRKRRKEESLEEDPPSPGPVTTQGGTVGLAPLLGQSEHSKVIPGVSDPNQQQQQQERKGVSVIQHTSSFEKQESIYSEGQKPELVESQQTPQPQSKPSPSTSRLIRQPNIQVPEIFITGEPDTDMPSVSQSETVSSSKGAERVEEFHWPQRSQTLAQLPAEKLPPKKKRLRLAEAAQSSGESSFESLPRSPSQERGTSSFSSSFEDTTRSGQPMRSFGSQSYQMLTVPSTPHQHPSSQKEMRRSASEQTPASPQQAEQMTETRSKSFDCGALSTQPPTSSWKDKRKCLLVQHATLGEQEQEMASAQSQMYRADSPKPGPSLSSYPPICSHEMISQPQILPSSQDVLPLHPQSQQAFPSRSLPRFLPEVLSTQFLQSTFLNSQIRTQPSQLHQPMHLHMTEQLGIPPYQTPSLVPLQFSSSPRTGHALYLPFSTIPTAPSFSVRESDSIISSLSTALNQQSLVTFSYHHPRPVIVTCLAQFTPVVSLMVPVRLQTHIPKYPSAIYTTLSPILSSSHSKQPTSSTSMVIVSQTEGDKLQSNYLKVPSPEIKSLLSITLPAELSSSPAEEYGPLGAGGSKRMLSPAASLELSTEAQRHQKRVKEEEEEEEQKSKEGKGKDVVEKARREEESKAKEKKLVKEEKTRPEGTKGTTVKVEKGQDRLPREETQKDEEEDKDAAAKTGFKKDDGVKKQSTPSYPSLHTSTSVNWCYLNYVKPNPLAHSDARNSVYSTWSVSNHNPNLPGFSTKVALSLLCSKQKHCSETYTMAMVPTPTQGKVAPGGSKNPRMSEVHSTSSSGIVKGKDELEHEEEQKEKTEDEGPSTSKPSEPSRVRIFEGGYKSNEDYVYVRGRGRGKYICEECGIRCKKPSMLRKHIRSHTDVRPYICKHCNFAFKTKGNLTKHMKSKAHGKKCQALGISESSLDEPESEETGDEHAFGTDEQEEHQFSDVEHSDDDDEEEEEEDEEEEESGSHEDLPSSCSSDTRLSTRSSCSQRGTPDPKELRPSPSQEPSPRGIWPSRQAASPGSKRALFSRGGWKASPRTFSPSSESCSPSRSLSPRLELSSPIHTLSPRAELSSHGRRVSPSPERGPSPIRAPSPVCPISPCSYRSTQVRTPPSPLVVQPRVPSYLPWESPSPKWSPFKMEKSGTSGEWTTLPESSFVPSTFRLSTGEGYPGQQTVDTIFSHLPMHSQQVRIPYSMIPIGGIQMVQARPRSHPTTPSSPTSPPLEGPSLGRFESYWGGTPRIQGRRTLGDYKSEQVGGASSPSSQQGLSTALSFPKPESETTDLKQYGSLQSFFHTDRPAAATPEHCMRDSHSSVTEQQSKQEQQPSGSDQLKGGTEGDSAETDQST